MQTNLTGYESPLSRNRHRIPYVSDSKPSNDTDHKLDKIMRNAHEVLYKADTVFPFTLFPDTVIIDRSKITLIKRNFFLMSETFSIRIEDILNVTTSLGPFFGSVQIFSRVFNTDTPHVVKFLPRDAAIRIKHITQGYVIATHEDIDCSNLSKSELIDTLMRLGRDETL
jgi:hypothetical protein